MRSGKTLYHCRWENCEKAYTKPSRLAEHYRSHTGERPFECTECDSKFFRKSHLDAHDKAKHADKKYKCSLCPFTFSLKHHLTRHALVHEKESKKTKKQDSVIFLCEACKDEFETKKDLEEHVQTHLLVCKVCEKVFKTDALLRQHSHTETTCNECGTIFSKKSALNTHISTVHKKVKKFNCIECSKCFGTKQSLQRHLETHKNKPRTEKRRRIQYKAPALKDPYEHAVESIVGIEMLSCPHCDKKYVRKSGLTKHLNSKH